MTNENPQSEYNPLDEEVIKRSYSSNEIDSENSDPIPEFNFRASFDTAKEAEPDGNPAPVDYSDQPSFNPSLNDLPDKEKRKAAELAADTVLTSYAAAMGFLGKVVVISEKKLGNEIAEGRIDPSLKLPIDANGNFVTIGEYAKDFNDIASEAFSVSEDFNSQMRPPLIRVLEKRNIGMSDETFLMVGFAQDIGIKAYTAFGLKKQTNEVLKMLREQTNLMKENASASHFTPAGNSEPSGIKPDIVKPEPEDNEPAPKKEKKQPEKKAIVSPQDFKKKAPGSNFAEGPKHKGLPTIPTVEELEHLEMASKRGEEAAKIANSKKD